MALSNSANMNLFFAKCQHASYIELGGALKPFFCKLLCDFIRKEYDYNHFVHYEKAHSTYLCHKYSLLLASFIPYLRRVYANYPQSLLPIADM